MFYKSDGLQFTNQIVYSYKSDCLQGIVYKLDQFTTQIIYRDQTIYKNLLIILIRFYILINFDCASSTYNNFQYSATWF